MVTHDDAPLLIEKLIQYANRELSLDPLDNCYVRNELCDLMRCEAEPRNYPLIDQIVDFFFEVTTPLCDIAVQIGLIDEEGRDRFQTKLFGMVTPRPAQIVDEFDRIANLEGIKNATNWFYDLCCKNNYIRTRQLRRNKIIQYSDEKNGDLVITINLSKPEKDPREIAKAKLISSDYPTCMLCVENEGYSGRPGYPARNNLRIIPFVLDDEQWRMQYSPYGYFDQHCIVFSEDHHAMHLNRGAFTRMIEFVELIPHYFVGSNAPLPIVGGSILSHDHYQGGSKVHPMFKRKLRESFTHRKFPGVKIGIVDWYNSVIRLRSKKKDNLINCIMHIFNSWENYSDESVGIIAKSGETPHNTVTPIIRLERGEYWCELILRNNRTDSEHPYGIFHPTEDMHNVKKENIGLIEAIGTFILPGRLDAEIKGIVDILSGEVPYDEVALNNPKNPLHKHKFVIDKMLSRYGKTGVTGARTNITKYIQKTCVKVIECTAVFKKTKKGRDAFDRFMDYLGCKKIEAENKD